MSRRTGRPLRRPSVRRLSVRSVRLLVTIVLLFLRLPAWGQVSETAPLFRELAALDSVVFEAGFNRCELAALEAVVSDDLTFYHDQGGVQDKAAFVRAMRENICSTPDHKPIRRAVPRSIEVFPLFSGGRLYGAIQSGTHEFYIREPGRDLYRTGAAAFTSLWLRKDGVWKLAHALSYDHRAAPVAPTPTSARGTFDAFAAQLGTLRREHRLPGLAAAVVRDGETVWAEGFGVSDVDEDVPVTPDTPFWIASITKTFVGLTFLGLEADGLVDLDAPLADLPGFHSFCAWLADSPLPFGRDLDCAAPITVRTVLTHTSNGDVGHAFLYNPLLYSRLSRYLEWAVNDSTEIEGGMNELARQIEARILSPAGMSRTVASQWDRSKMDVVYDMARGYGVEGDGFDRRWVLRPPPKRAIAAGAGVVSTVLDLGRYVAALESGRLAPPPVMDRLLTPPASRDGTPLPYAYGWYVQTYRGERLVWHSGWDEEAGTSSLLLWLPERALGLVVLANGEGVWWENPLDAAAVERSPFARAFLDRFVFPSPAAE